MAENLKMTIDGDVVRCNRKIYFFGCGVVAKRILSQFGKHFDISGFATDYSDDWGKIIDGIKVYPANEILNNRDNFIVIATNKAFEKISDRFQNMGLIPQKDFMHYTVWLREYFEIMLRERNILLQDYGELYITDKCTLKCKHCALFAPYFKNPQDRDLEECKRDISLYFKFVDKVSVFRVLGGETFLYRPLAELLTFISENYGKQIGELLVVTNGTIIPARNILEVLAKHNIRVLISDYQLELAQKKRQKLLETFENNGVNYTIFAVDEWRDTWGNPTVEKFHSESEAIKVFNGCYVWCRVPHKGKFYFCLNDLAAKRMGFVEEDSNDCVDLEQDQIEKVKKEILLLDSKKIKKGYVNFCKNCFSMSPQNSRVIPVAEQSRAGEKIF